MTSMYIDDRRPTSHLGKFQMNGNISASGHPIHFMFGSMVGFSSSADRMALSPVGVGPAAIVENFEGPYLCNRSSDPVYVWSVRVRFWCRRPEWRNFRLHQILKNVEWPSATGRLVQFRSRIKIQEKIMCEE